MNIDKIAVVVQHEKLIAQYGAKLFKSHGHQKHRHQYIRQKLNELGRLLISLKKADKCVHGLWECIKPEKFSLVVNCVKVVAGFDCNNKTYLTPLLALTLDHSLKACTREIRRQVMMNGLHAEKQAAEEFIT
jgi:hypothetical protein